MERNSQPIVSIVVPLYNQERYLGACLRSILDQTYQNIEVIIVNDGSTDDSLSIARNWADKDSRIKLVDKPNQGVTLARRDGYLNATGDYLAFVDSDDIIHPKMLEVLHNLINSGDYDFSMVHGVMVEDKGLGYNHADDIKPIEEYLNSLNVELTQGQYDALVSFTYNLGLGKLKGSTLLKCVKAKQFKAASEQLAKWIYVNNKVSRGLINRRDKEKELFLS